MESAGHFRAAVAAFTAPTTSSETREQATAYLESLKTDVNGFNVAAATIMDHRNSSITEITMALIILRPVLLKLWYQKDVQLSSKSITMEKYLEAVKTFLAIRDACCEIVTIHSSETYKNITHTNAYIELSSAVKYALHVYALIIKKLLLMPFIDAAGKMPEGREPLVLAARAALAALRSENGEPPLSNILLLEAIVSECGRVNHLGLYNVTARKDLLFRKSFDEDELAEIGLWGVHHLMSGQLSTVGLIHFMKLMTTVLQFWDDMGEDDEHSRKYYTIKLCLFYQVCGDQSDSPKLTGGASLLDVCARIENQVLQYGFGNVMPELVTAMGKLMEVIVSQNYFLTLRRNLRSAVLRRTTIIEAALVPVENLLCQSCVKVMNAIMSQDMARDAVQIALAYLGSLQESWCDFAVRHSLGQVTETSQCLGRLDHVVKVCRLVETLYRLDIGGDDLAIVLHSALKMSAVFVTKLLKLPLDSPETMRASVAAAQMMCVFLGPGWLLLGLYEEGGTRPLEEVEPNVLDHERPSDVQDFQLDDDARFLENMTYVALVGRLCMKETATRLLTELSKVLAQEQLDESTVDYAKFLLFFIGRLFNVGHENELELYYTSSALLHCSRVTLPEIIKHESNVLAKELEPIFARLTQSVEQAITSEKILATPALIPACVMTLTLLIEAYGNACVGPVMYNELRSPAFVSHLIEVLFGFIIKCNQRYPGSKAARLCLRSFHMIVSNQELYSLLCGYPPIYSFAASIVSLEEGSLRNTISLYDLKRVAEALMENLRYSKNNEAQARLLAVIGPMRHLAQNMASERMFGTAAAVLSGITAGFIGPTRLTNWLVLKSDREEDILQALTSEVMVDEFDVEWLPIVMNPQPEWSIETHVQVFGVIAGIHRLSTAGGAKMYEQLMTAMHKQGELLQKVLADPDWDQDPGRVRWLRDYTQYMYYHWQNTPRLPELPITLTLPFVLLSLQKVDPVEPTLRDICEKLMVLLETLLENKQVGELTFKALSEETNIDSCLEHILQEVKRQSKDRLVTICEQVRTHPQYAPRWIGPLSQMCTRLVLSELEREKDERPSVNMGTLNDVVHNVLRVLALDSDRFLKPYLLTLKNEICKGEPRTEAVVDDYLNDMYIIAIQSARIYRQPPPSFLDDFFHTTRFSQWSDNF